MQQDTEECEQIKCQICNEYFLNQMWLLEHVKKIHIDSHLYTCKFSDCAASYNNENSLKSHCYRKHKGLFSSTSFKHSERFEGMEMEDAATFSRDNIVSDVTPQNENYDRESESISVGDPDPDDSDNSSYSSDNSSDDPDENPDPDDEPNVNIGNNDNNAFKTVIADYILYLRGRTRATNDDVLGILSQLQIVVESYVRYYLNHTAQILHQELQINLNNYVNIEETIAEINCSCNLDSVYSQDVYFEEEYGVVQPTKIELGSSFVPHGTPANDGNQPLRRKVDEMIFIPMSSVLSNWFRNDDFQRLIQIPQKREDRVLASYADGTFFQNHPFRQQHPNSLFIRLYYDEADMCDTVGSKGGGANKLGFFYWILEDMLPIYKSQLKFINLASIVPYPLVKKYGLAKILPYIVNDFKKMENGIDLPNGEKIYATLSIPSGDNLGVHQLCGFKESFVFNCRWCSANSQQMKTMIREDETLLRIEAEHDLQTEQIEDEQNPREKEELSKQYGINSRCPLNELTGSHATKTTQDIVHDDLLGFCVLTTKCFLYKVCFEEEFITLDNLNERIQEFDYGYSEKSSKPSIIKRQHILGKKEGFRQNASQMWQLVTMLPLILSDCVPEVYPAFQNYLLMLQILCISFGDKISVPMVSYLNAVIAEYLETFQVIYERNLIPKQHFLSHRPSRIVMFGPVSHFTTIRQEAKHQIFKRESQGKRTYKNVPLTLAKKHQLFQASVLRETLLNRVETGPKTLTFADTEPFTLFFTNDSRLFVTSWIKFNGIKYVATKCLIAVNYNEDNMPQFAALHKICLLDGTTVFICKKVKTIEHNLVIMAYEIEIVEEFVIYSFEDLHSHNVFHSHQLKDKQFVIVKKALGDFH